MKKTYSLTLMAVLVLIMSACKDKKPLDIPEQYISADFDANVVAENNLRAQFDQLVSIAKAGRTTGVFVNRAVLAQAFSTDLNYATTTYYTGRLNLASGWFDQLSTASGLTWSPDEVGSLGGTYGGYLFDGYGLELEQLVDKGMYGATLYHYATQLMSGEITPATVDRLVRIYGAHPDFPNTPTILKATNADKFMAGYAARRDKNDGNGLYTQMKTAFITLKAAVEAGDKYNEERDQALEDIQLTWEKINAATVINYCHSVISTMSATSPTDDDKAKALHAYSECVGFIHGWRTIPQDYKRITDAQIDLVLTLLEAPANGTPKSYLFVTDPVNKLPQLQQVIDDLKGVYGFTDAEIEDFKKNWVTEQGR